MHSTGDSESIDGIFETDPDQNTNILKARRNFLKKVAKGAAAIALSPLLKGCALLEGPTQVTYEIDEREGVEIYSMMRPKKNQADREIVIDYISMPGTSPKRAPHRAIVVKDEMGYHIMDAPSEVCLVKIPIKGTATVYYEVSDEIKQTYISELTPTALEQEGVYVGSAAFSNPPRLVCRTHNVWILIKDDNGKRRHNFYSWCGGDEFSIDTYLKGPATISFYDRGRLIDTKSFSPPNQG